MSASPPGALARPDLASAALEGVLPAARYAATRDLRCSAPAAAIRRAPDGRAEQLDQLLFGEAFDVLETQAGWAWGQARRDGYVGFIEQAALASPGSAPTHRVAALRAYAFAEPDLKSAALGPFSINALVAVGAPGGRFVQAGGLGWMVEAQLAPLGRFETDFVAVAERFVGAAYLWGGRESQGLDCSGLVQQALLACGRACPRDTGQQQAMGEAIGVAQLQRGDLVFWPGHVAIMLDRARVIHANAHHAAVAVEPLSEVVARKAGPGNGRPSACRRL